MNFGGREPDEKRSSLPIESSLALVVSLLSPQNSFALGPKFEVTIYGSIT